MGRSSRCPQGKERKGKRTRTRSSGWHFPHRHLGGHFIQRKEGLELEWRLRGCAPLVPGKAAQLCTGLLPGMDLFHCLSSLHTCLLHSIHCPQTLRPWLHSLLPSRQTYCGVQAPCLSAFPPDSSISLGLFSWLPHLERHLSMSIHPLFTAPLSVFTWWK